MGNVTTAIVKRDVGRARKRVVVDITGAASYATNGDTVQQADIDKIFGETGHALTEILDVASEISSAGHSVFLDKTNKKVKFFNGTTEIANATNLSAVTVRVQLEYGQVTGP